MNKYGNRRVFYDGYWFDSKLERDRYIQLRLLERAGEIKDLRIQVPFELQEAYMRNGKRVQAIVYIADFTYYDKKLGKTVVEDVKGIETDVFKLKRRCLNTGIEI